MKCHYYLAQDVERVSEIRDDLENVGIDNWYIHVLNKNEGEVEELNLHSGNFIETSDASASGLIGGALGLAIGLIIAIVLAAVPTIRLPAIVYAIIVVAPALMGFWEGSLLRAKYAGPKIDEFQDEIEAGNSVILVYVPKDKSKSLKRVMRKNYPDVQPAAVDEHFANPLARVRRNT